MNRFSSWAALALVIVGGTLPRLNHIGKSIWSAEAWVANSVLADSIGHMFHYEAWLQTTPPLFLLLVRGIVHLAGVSVGSLRAVPFGLSMMSLILVAWLSGLILQTPFAVLCTTLVALSPPAVVFSKEVKQYSGDLVTSCLLLFVLWTYWERPDRWRYVGLAVAVAIALPFSYPAVAFLPSALAISALVQPKLDRVDSNDWKIRTRRVGILLVIGAAICTTNYWFFVKPNTSPMLANYWSSGYPQFSQFNNVVRFYAEYFLGMGVYFYLPISTKDLFKSVLSSLGWQPLLLVAIASVASLGLALTTLRHNKRHLRALILCFMPMVALAVLNLLHLYPVNSRRLTLFMLPCMSLAAAIVIENLWTTLSSRMQWKNNTVFPMLLTLSCIVVVFVAGIHSDQWANYWFEDEDTGGAFRYLRSHIAPEDTIYIHASIAEPAKLYFRILRWDPPNVRYGNTGWGCCPRNPEARPDDRSSTYNYVVRDFSTVIGENRVERLWLLYTARSGHWLELGLDEPQVIANYLYGKGCRKEMDRRFANEDLEEFGCEQRDSR